MNGDDEKLTDLRHFHFALIWGALAEEGQCDGPGGAEYRRVYSEWLAADYPNDIAEFIRRRANVGPNG